MPKKDINEGILTNTHHILFPHTQITAQNFEKIGNRFENLTLCLPWFMEGPATETEETDTSWLHVQYPNASLKPKEDFNKLISEYRIWVNQNQDKGYGSFLGATQGGTLTEDTPWEIRQLISGRETRSDLQESRSFKWHLILHLAREFEESRVEVEEMLNKLMTEKSPLEGALEIDPPKRIFEDTPLMESQLQVDEHHLRQIFEAWFGLFGEFVSEDATLITFDPMVMNYASQILEPEEKIIRAQEPKEEPSVNVKHLPQLSDDEKKSRGPVPAALSGKTIILMDR